MELRDVLNTLIDAYCAADNATEQLIAAQARLTPESNVFPALIRGEEQAQAYRASATASLAVSNAKKIIAAQQALLAIYMETHNKLVAAGL
jgi:hypothetical protein